MAGINGLNRANPCFKDIKTSIYGLILGIGIGKFTVNKQSQGRLLLGTFVEPNSTPPTTVRNTWCIYTEWYEEVKLWLISF